jgi:hypothetical protein
MPNEFWVVRLPVPGNKRLRDETPIDHMNRELTELVERGWEPTSMALDTAGNGVFLMRKPGVAQ